MKQWWHEVRAPANFRIAPRLPFPTWDILAAALLLAGFSWWFHSSFSPFFPPVTLTAVDGVLIWLFIRGLFALVKLICKR